MRVVGLKKHLVAGHRDAAIHPGVLHHAGGSRAHESPDLAAAARVERDAFVHIADVHEAARHDRSHLQPGRRRCRRPASAAGGGISEHPASRQARHVRLRDLRHGGVAIPARVSVVTGPVDFGSHFAVLRAGAAQQMNPAVVRPNLHIVEAFAELCAAQRLPGRGLDRDSGLASEAAASATGGARLDRVDEAHQIGKLLALHGIRRHPAGGQARVDQVGQLIVGAKARQARRDVGAHLAAFAVASVASTAAQLERAAACIVLSGRSRSLSEPLRRQSAGGDDSQERGE